MTKEEKSRPASLWKWWFRIASTLEIQHQLVESENARITGNRILEDRNEWSPMDSLEQIVRRNAADAKLARKELARRGAL